MSIAKHLLFEEMEKTNAEYEKAEREYEEGLQAEDDQEPTEAQIEEMEIESAIEAEERRLRGEP